MKILFASLPGYSVGLGSRHLHWHRARRLGADKVFRSVTGMEPESGKKSLCRGLWVLASEAKRAGHTVQWVDLSCESPSIPSESAAWADQLWLYAMTPTVETCLAIAGRAKSANAKLQVFLGGPHTRHCYVELLMQNLEIDYVEANVSTPTGIMAEVWNPRSIPGIAYRDGGRIRTIASDHPRRYCERVDPSVLPTKLDTYYINTSSSRGCSRTCAYCVEGMESLRLRDGEDLEEELRLLDRALGSTGAVHFFDASLWDLPQRCLELSRFIFRETCIGSFSCDLEPQRASPEVLRSLTSARIRSVAMGFESCVDELLIASGKGGTFEKRVEYARSVRSFMPGTAIKAYWLLGLPGTTALTLKKEHEGIRYLLEEGIVDLVSAKLLVPYPGTPYFEKPQAFGLTQTPHYQNFDRYRLPPACFPTEVGAPALSNALLGIEKLIAELYAKRLGMTLSHVMATPGIPKRYNGPLYTGNI